MSFFASAEDWKRPGDVLGRPIAGLLCCCAILLLAPSGLARAAENRLALVIGEARYATAPLVNPANDAGAVAQSLAAADFEVTGYADLDRDGLRRALAGFLDKTRLAGPDATVFVYLAGYGVQFDGGNFMAPVDARIARDIDVPAEAVSLGDFARDLAAVPLKARILVYDLARPNRFAPEEPSLAHGLAAVEPPAGTLIAFNAAPGTESDDYPGDYGLYAEALTEAMQTRGLSLATLATRLRLRVAALSGGRTVPWSAGAVEGTVSLLPPVSEGTSILAPLKTLVTGTTPPEAYWTALKSDTLPAYRDFLKAHSGDPLTARVGQLLAVRREATMWMLARRANVANAYWTYMRFYPRGPHFADARRLLAALPAALEPPPRFDVYAFDALPGPHADEVALLKSGEEPLVVPPPASSDLPPRRAEFYERLPPLLAVVPGSLPLAVPVVSGRPTAYGRIVQPGSAAGGEAVVAADVADAGGNLAVVQSARDGRILSTASVTLEPNGSRSLVQTGLDRQPIMAATDRIEANGRRTIVQTGRDKQVIFRSVTDVAPDGSRTVALAGPQGAAATLRVDAAGVLAKPAQGATVSPPPPPLIATPRPSVKASPPPPLPPPPKVASTMPLPTLTDGAPPKAPEPPQPLPQASLDVGAVPTFSGTGSPTIALPGRTASQPLGPPVVPLDPAPLAPPKMALQTPVPDERPAAPTAAPAAAVGLPSGTGLPSNARRPDASPPVAEPVPPRRRPEVASASPAAPAVRAGKPSSGASRRAETSKAKQASRGAALAAKGGKAAAGKASKTSVKPPTGKPAKPTPGKRAQRR